MQTLLGRRSRTQWVSNMSEKEFRMIEASLSPRYSFKHEKDTISVHLMDLKHKEKNILYLLPTTRDTDRQAAWCELHKPLERVLRCSDCYEVLEIPRSTAASLTSNEVSKLSAGKRCWKNDFEQCQGQCFFFSRNTA